MKKVNGGVLFLLLLSGIVFASQDFILGPDGRHYRVDSDVRAIPNSKESIMARSRVTPQVPLATEDFDLRWPDGGDLVNFGFSTHEPTPAVGDSIAQWMVPAAEATVKMLMLYNVNFEGTFEFCLYESNYSGEAEVAGCADAAGWVGLYLDANGEQCEDGDDCTWSAGDDECFSDPPLGAEIWPGLGIGCWSVELDGEEGWLDPIDMSSIGYAEGISDDFFIAGLATRTAGWGIGALPQPVTPYHGFKYYWEEDGGTSGNWGWHIRTYGWELYAVVEYTADPAPFILDLTVLGPTLSEDPREVSATVTDINPIGDAGVEDVTLHWSINEGSEQTATMEADADTFSAEITGAGAGDAVEYYVTAEDVEGNMSESPLYGYSIFEPVEDGLLVNNGDFGQGTVELYYLFGLLGEFEFDYWSVNDLGADRSHRRDSAPGLGGCQTGPSGRRVPHYPEPAA
ncbi:MAG: hypothetical protein V3U24_11650, partial [Candidatus Neomarinimicrobiota bacterium]